MAFDFFKSKQFLIILPLIFLIIFVIYSFNQKIINKPEEIKEVNQVLSNDEEINETNPSNKIADKESNTPNNIGINIVNDNECVYNHVDEFLVILEKNVSLCSKTENIEDCKSYYYLIMGFKENDLNQCTFLDSDVGLCQNVLNNDITACDSLSLSSDVISCKSFILNDINLCTQIIDVQYKTDCYEHFLLLNAFKTKDMSYCNSNLTDIWFKTFCKGMLSDDSVPYKKLIIEQCNTV